MRDSNAKELQPVQIFLLYIAQREHKNCRDRYGVDVFDLK